MSVYVDSVNILWRNAYWCHMLADSLEELHLFAKHLGVKRHWFHRNASYPHYDITREMRDYAINQGALIGSRELIISCAKQLKRELNQTVNHTHCLHHHCCRTMTRQRDLFNSTN
ncbi:hypothetical protein MIZ03_4711 [Rhodoferax lithotrophicus]|uniref:DUF4031 domain-containing protein n=1 Tax=Rhodoferax lithotrophicus TaxID=2798804 RepID=A0ABN6DCQ3_9BURK|nr:DUF4031 domain-containing protein [Rhodoferax sp. MIZ03]BCO29787.1 hypothetical protein MIZ03_4711 [Rhodoferax sp. MIZ03]